MHGSKETTAMIVTELPRLSTGELDLTALPARLDDLTLDEVKAIVDAPLPSLPPCDSDHLTKVLRTMLAVLPRRNADDLAGELFAAAYEDALWKYPNDAITFLGRDAMRNCKWFPTIAECIERISEWRRDDEPARRWKLANSLFHRELAARRSFRPIQEDNWKPAPGELERIKQEVADVLRTNRGEPTQ